jgi:arsenical pump membrane protein
MFVQPIILPISLFLLTLIFVIWQPKGLSVGWSASGGAVLALLFGVVDWPNVWTVIGIVWNATIAFVAAMIIALIMEEIGFFSWAALHMARFARGNGRLLFVYLILLGAMITALFNNDGAILILTPIILAMMRSLQFSTAAIFAFVMAGGFIADSTSLPLIISNLVNILSADSFDIGFVEYAQRMLMPNFVSLVVSLLCLFILFRSRIPTTFDHLQLQKPETAIRDPFLFRLSWWMMAFLLMGYLSSEIWHLPVSLIAGLLAILFLLFTLRRPHIQTGRMLKEAPWTVIVFSIGMYVVVYGLKNAGLTDLLGKAIAWLADYGLVAATLGMGLIAAVLSSLMNNLPTVMFDALAIQSVHVTEPIKEALIYANIIGSDLGPKMTPLGSLATLLWLHLLAKKEIHIGWKEYCLYGIALTLPTLILTLLSLAGWLWILNG